MTTIGLTQERQTGRALSLEAPRLGADEDERRYALTFDRLQPCFVDYSCFAQAISGVAAAYKGRAKMLELGCGTGLLAMEVLSAAGHLDYHGVDASEPMIELFGQKAAALAQTGRSISLTAPADPRRKQTIEALKGEAVDFVVMSQLLQSAPPGPSPGLLDRVGLLLSARRFVRPGGKLFIIEEVFGETTQEHALLTNQWHSAAVDQICAGFLDIQSALRDVDPGLVDLLARVPGQPSLVRVVRDQLRRYGEPQVPPLSAWCALFEHLKLRYRALPHSTLKHFYLFAIDHA